MKVIIVGGVAGGASCAARLRRLDEKVEILMVERGPTFPFFGVKELGRVLGQDKIQALFFKKRDG